MIWLLIPLGAMVMWSAWFWLEASERRPKRRPNESMLQVMARAQTEAREGETYGTFIERTKWLP